MRFKNLKLPLSRLFWPVPPAAAEAEVAPPGAAAASESTAGSPAAESERLAHLIETGAIDPQQLAALAVEGASSRLRQLAAQRVTDPTALRHVLNQVRGHDKSVYKIVKQKLDALLAAERRASKIESDVAALHESLERHSRRVVDATYATSLKLFEEEWHGLEAQSAPDIADRIRGAIARCRENAVRRLEDQAAQASRQAALESSRQEAAARAAAQELRVREESALAAAEAAKARELEEKTQAERAAAEAHALREIGALIGQVNAAIRDGNTRRAAGLRRAIGEKLAAAPAVPSHVANQLLKLDARLDELKQWKDYAVAPKRAELIEEMESLIGSSEAPKALADRIKALQEDWKAMSKGVGGDSKADWQRFHQASQSAYQPCREYFEAQAKLRQANAEKRQEVLSRLRAFETAQSGEHPDWRAVAAVLREAPQEWRRYFPIDRQAERVMQEEFDGAIGRLRVRLEAWQTQNAADKQSLIQRARQLRAKDDGREAVDTVKRLQLLWKDVGPAPRDQEQSLWGEFREQCDAVYQKRQQALAEYTAGLEASKLQAVALCEEAEQAAAASGAALIEGVGKLARWRAAFDALGEMPRADQRALFDRFERAVELCRVHAAGQLARDRELTYSNLLEAARRIGLYGWSVRRDGASPGSEALKQSAESFIAGVANWPKSGVEALEQCWSRAQAGTDADLAANEKALRMLCIRGEILGGRATPSEDQTLRREYQVQRLVERMGQGTEANPDDLAALSLAWVRIGLVAPAAHEALLARFLGCR
jgi:Domain of Unknown Function (DUF349)